MLNTTATGEDGLDRTGLALPLPWPHARDAGEGREEGDDDQGDAGPQGREREGAGKWARCG